jgi:hypothetical protein
MNSFFCRASVFRALSGLISFAYEHKDGQYLLVTKIHVGCVISMISIYIDYQKNMKSNRGASMSVQLYNLSLINSKGNNCFEKKKNLGRWGVSCARRQAGIQRAIEQE